MAPKESVLLLVSYLYRTTSPRSSSSNPLAAAGGFFPRVDGRPTKAQRKKQLAEKLGRKLVLSALFRKI